jgi:hypothetical protein
MYRILTSISLTAPVLAIMLSMTAPPATAGNIPEAKKTRIKTTNCTDLKRILENTKQRRRAERSTQFALSDEYAYPRAVIKAANQVRSDVANALKKTSDKSEQKALKKKDKEAKAAIKKRSRELKALDREYSKTEKREQALDNEVKLIKQEMRKLKCK